MDPRSQALIQRRRRLLALTPVDRAAALLAARDPGALVRALPAQDFYLTIAAAGLDSSLPLLTHAAPRQLEFIFDIDCWAHDQFDPARAAHWLEAFRAADPELVARWLATTDEELVVLTLHRLLSVFKADESTDSRFWPPQRPLPALDRLYYFEPRAGAFEDAAAALLDGLERLRAVDRNGCTALLEQVLWAVPPELEEECRRRRAARLAERGFPELEEALEVWTVAGADGAAGQAALTAKVRAAPDLQPGDGAAALPVLEGRLPSVLACAAAHLDAERRERLLADLVRLGNRYAVANLGPLGDPATHRGGLEHALSLVSLGLEQIANGDVERLGPRALATLSVFELNRAGVGAVEERAAAARRHHERGWLARVRLAHDRLDASLAETLAGLLRPRPAFTAAGSERPFRDRSDLAAADAALRAIDSLGRFLERRLGLGAHDPPELTPAPLLRDSPGDIEWSAVALTTLAAVALGAPARPTPLSGEAARRALAVLLTRRPPRRVTTRFRELAAELDLDGAADFLAQRLEADCGELAAAEAPDPRFVRALLFREEPPSAGREKRQPSKNAAGRRPGRGSLRNWRRRPDLNR